MNESDLDQLTAALLEFVREREWEQFHSPKNLSMAICVEAAELAEHFIWTDARESMALNPEERGEVALEVADVFLYTLRMSQVMGIDLIATSRKKLDMNAVKYPADQVRGSAKRYSDYG